MVDTHAHLNSPEFQDDYADAARRAFENGIIKIINVGDDFVTSRRAVEIAKEFEQAYAAVGAHPHCAGKEEFDAAEYRELAKNKKVVAIGETGLDYFPTLEVPPALRSEAKDGSAKYQKDMFLKHIELAKELDLPLILHCRGSKDNPKDAYEDMINELKVESCKLKGVVHCFSSDWEIARKFLNMGFYIGFTGNITYSKNDKLLEVIKKVPADRILTETDCPYLAPQPVRGQRNEPRYVKFVLEKIAEVRGISFEEAEEITTKNAKRLFGI